MVLRGFKISKNVGRTVGLDMIEPAYWNMNRDSQIGQGGGREGGNVARGTPLAHSRCSPDLVPRVGDKGDES